jgi:hypothetical protein
MRNRNEGDIFERKMERADGGPNLMLRIREVKEEREGGDRDEDDEEIDVCISVCVCVCMCIYVFD